MIKQISINNAKTLFTIKKSNVFTLFIAHIVLAIAFFSGVAEIDGVTLGLFNSLKKLKLFWPLLVNELPGTVEMHMWLTVLLSVVYIVLCVLVTKRLISTISTFKKLFSNYDVEDEKTEFSVLFLYERFGVSFINIVSYILIARVCSEFDLNAMAIFTLVIGVGVFLFTRFSFYIHKDCILIDCVYKLITDFILILSVIMFSLYCAEKAVFDIFNLSISAYQNELFQELVCIVFKVIISIFNLMVLNNIFTYRNYRHTALNYVNTLLKATIILSGIYLLICMFKHGFSNLDSILGYLKPFAGIIMLAVAQRLVFTFPKLDDEYEKSNERSENKSNVDENKLVILDGTKMIDEYQYRDNTEITSAVIPKSVVFVGKGAFSGCGGLTDIYCKAKGKPENWDKDWLDGCYATIHWGDDDPKNEDTTTQNN